MLSGCVIGVLWMPGERGRHRGIRTALSAARDTLLCGIADRSATSVHTDKMRRSQMTDEKASETLQRLELLASALAERPVAVAAVDPGEPSWTDGQTIFIDADDSPRHRLEALAVQACLVAAGSLDHDVLRKLTRRANATRRYLAIEGQRALAANESFLPGVVKSLIDRGPESQTASAAASLDIALSREPIADPSPRFGTIHPRKVLAKQSSAQSASAAGEHIPRKEKNRPLAELDDSRTDEDEELFDPFSSPIGGSGPLGKLFAKMLSVVRKLSGDGPPGADAATHRTRGGTRGGNAVMTRAQPGTDGDIAGDKGGMKYPEWDVHRRRYRPDWCTVHEVEPPMKSDTSLASWEPGLRRPLGRLGVGLQHYHRQAQGDDIDIDAAVEARVEVLAGSAPDEAVYLDTLRRRRDLGVLVLLDVSGSVAEPGTQGQSVHEQQRTASAALTAALHSLGDRVALYAFASQGRSDVHVMPVKRFDDHLDSTVMRRLHGLVPGAYSRLGAAIRHGAAVLEERAGTPRRLLVVISDGLAYDLGYERVYGAADARHALAEARQRGTGCLCLTVGASTDVDVLRQVFGSAAHATIPSTQHLSEIVGPLFRAALRSAEVRRRVGQRKSAPARTFAHRSGMAADRWTAVAAGSTAVMEASTNASSRSSALRE